MRLHHLGVVVPSIQEASAHYRLALGYTERLPTIYDPQQDARLTLLAPPAGGPGIELIEPSAPSSRLAKQARRGGIAHSCYEVTDLRVQVERLRQVGALLVQGPVPATLFGGREVAFLYLPTKHLIELLAAA